LQQPTQESEPIRLVFDRGEGLGEEKSQWLSRRKESQRQHHHRDAGNVVDGAEIIETSDGANPNMIENGMRQEKAAEYSQITARRIGQTDQRRHELGATVVNPRNRRDETDQIQPGREPTPGRSTQHRCPVIQRTRRRNG
jgi:K+/H+ antiporter YhaU regulatory subunit KhtT